MKDVHLGQKIVLVVQETVNLKLKKKRISLTILISMKFQKTTVKLKILFLVIVKKLIGLRQCRRSILSNGRL